MDQVHMTNANSNTAKQTPHYERVVRYYLLDTKNTRICVGASQGVLAGFSFNFIRGVKTNARAMEQYIQKHVEKGFKIVDSYGNDLTTEELIAFANHSAKGKCFLTRHKDRNGVSFTRVN